MDRLRLLSKFIQPVRIIVTQERFAGHSKWQNIRHTKAANDAKRSKMISKYCQTVRRVALAGGFDPKVNDKLNDAMAAALKANVPKDSLLKCLEKAKNAKLAKEVLEIQGPGGCFLLVDVETDNISRTRHDIKKIMKGAKDSKVGLMREGSCKHAFEEKGIIQIPKQDKAGKEITLERAEEIAIEAGAEEVRDDNDDPEQYWILITDPLQIFEVKSVIEKTMPFIEIASTETHYLPIVRVPLSETDAEKAAEMCSRLQEMDEVNIIYDNIQ